MPPPLSQQSAGNLLLATLPPPCLEAVEPDVETIELELRQILVQPNAPLDHAYFLTEGICSIITTNPAGIRVETGLIGREGFIGAPVILGVKTSPYEIMAQTKGRALRLSGRALLAAMKQCQELATVLSRFIHLFTLQTSYTTLATAHNSLVERLARWFLMCHDRVHGDEFSMTDEFLRLILAVPPSDIDEVVQELEAKRTIIFSSDSVTVLSRSGLEQVAGGSYGMPESEYERLIAPFRKRAAAR